MDSEVLSALVILGVVVVTVRYVWRNAGVESETITVDETPEEAVVQALSYLTETGYVIEWTSDKSATARNLVKK